MLLNLLQHLRDHGTILMLRDDDPGGGDLLLKQDGTAIQNSLQLFFTDRF